MPAPPVRALNMNTERRGSPRRRYLTILFSDLSGSTRLAEKLEAEDYFDLLRRLSGLYHSVVARHGGTVAQISGDGMLALFGWPEPREGDGCRAVEAAIELHESIAELSSEVRAGAPLQLHSGIHAGLVLLHSGDQCHGRFELLGTATNLASRLCRAAAAGEILVSEETLGPELARFDTSARRCLQLRGSDSPIATRAVTGRATRNRTEPAPFVGRSAERTILEQRLAEARAGSPRFVAIEGPPGVGKTRLAEHFAKQAAALGCAIHSGACEPAAEPLRPFLEIARSILGPAIAEDPPEDDLHLRQACAERAEAFGRPVDPGCEGEAADASALKQLIERAAGRAPLVLLVDDWHHADDASRELMAQLRSEGRGAVLVLATARDDAVSAALAAGFEPIPLAPFDEAETGEAVARLLPSADPFTVSEIAAASGGNALFVEELCHSMAAVGRYDPPQGGTAWLANLIESRVSRLPAEAAALVRIAAVIGTSIPSWLLEAIGGRGAGEPLVASLAALDFVYPGDRPGTLRFKHGLTREVIYESVGLHERRQLHLRIAEALRDEAGRGAEEEPVEALALHYGAAGAVDETAHFAERAGDKALAASALDRAQAHYRAALAAIERLETTPKNEARWTRIAGQLGLASVFDPAHDQLPVFERAAERAAARRDRAGLAWAEHWLGYLRYGLGEPEAAMAHCSRALEAGLGHADDRLVVQIRATLGQAKAAGCDYGGALLLLDEAIEVKRRHRTGRHASVGFAYSLGSKAFVLGDMGRFAEAEAGFEEAMDAVRGARHEVEGSVLCQQAAVRLWQGRCEDAARFAAEAEQVGLRVHSVYLLAMSRAIGAYAQWALDRDPAHIETLVEAVGWLEAKRRGLFASLPYGWLADALVINGDLPRGRRYAARALRRARKGDRLGEAMAWRALSRESASAGRLARMEDCLARAAAAAAARDSAHEAAATQLCAADLALGGGEAERAALLLDGLAARFDGMEMHAGAAEARRLARAAAELTAAAR